MREINEIPAEKFRFVTPKPQQEEILPGKHIGYFREAFGRFRKNKSSVVAGIIILCLVAYAVFVPMFCQTSYSVALTDTTYLQYTKLKPRNRLFVRWGIPAWDGCSVKTLSRGNYLYLQGIARETGQPVIKKVLGETVDTDGNLQYKCRVDSYLAKGFVYMTLSRAEYEKIEAWQRENDLQVIYPMVEGQSDANIWYKANRKGIPQLDSQGNYVNQYAIDENGNYRYWIVTGDGSSYRCRVFLHSYFQYRYGFEPSFLLGTTGQGQDILTRLAFAARFSLVFALCVSAINLLIGAVYGAIEGYYGGTADLLMERITDILSRVPFLVVATLFQLHLAAKVGPIVSLLFAFVLTGWLGIANTTRMQFYRYKDREFVQAARVLGAGDGRIMFRHIFPNALGTIITGSVLVIPGVIFLESSLTYLGIVNLDSSTMTSVGTMLANGRQYLSTDPHIILFPALFISLLEISFNLVGNGLRDAFNPSLRGADQ
ncbi:MAG: ABC transporter permease [Oscillospiraceae bacterium]|nr:ABC transporter permease [Oscillospiraceae bacterium]